MSDRALQKFVISVFVISSIVTGALAGDRTPAGRTISYIGGDGKPFSVSYRRDGSLSAHSANGTSSGGTWQVVSPGQVCHYFDNPNWSRNSCKNF
jgi:hypothetical protein